MEATKKYIESKYSTYLIGAMEHTANDAGGRTWREELTATLEALGVFVFDPIKLESSKVNMSSKEFIDMISGYKKAGKWNKFMEMMDKIWLGVNYMENGQLLHIMGDRDYVGCSSFLIAYLKEGDKPGGTFVEMGWAHSQGKPIYVVTDINKSELNSSIIWLVKSSGGDVFKSFSQMLEYIKGRYHLEEKDAV